MSRVSSRAAPLVALVRAGAGCLVAHPRLCAVLYAAQFAAAFTVGWLATRILTLEYGRHPVFDRAVAGDLSSLVYVALEPGAVASSLMWLTAGAAAAYVILSWFLSGGLNAVLLADRTIEEGRRSEAAASREVARQFGAGGVATFWAYGRLALVSSIVYAVAALLALFAVVGAADDLGYTLTGTEAAGVLIPRLVPAAVILWIHTTAADYARIELTRRHARADQLSSLVALVTAYKQLFTDRRPLAHTLMHALIFAAITAVYVALTAGSPMAGAGGAVALFAIRQVVLVLRFANSMVRIGGQIAVVTERWPNASAAPSDAPTTAP